MFLIANAVSIAVLRRRPEIATLRALGDLPRRRSSAPFLVEGAVVGVAGTLLGEILGLVVSREAMRAVAGTVSSLYAADGAHRRGGLGRTGRPRRARRPRRVARRDAPARDRGDAGARPRPRCAPEPSSPSSGRRLPRRASLAALALALAAARSSRARRSTACPLFGFAAVGLVVVALALASPLLVRRGRGAAARPARPRTLGSRRAPRRGLLRRRAREERDRRHGARDGARHDARDDRHRRLDPRDRARLGRDDAALGPLDQDGRRRPDRDRRRPAARTSSRSCEAIEGVDEVDPFRARETSDERGRPFTLGVGRLPRGGPLRRAAAARRAGPAARRRSRPGRAGRSWSPSPSPGASRAGDGGRVRLSTPAGPREFRVAGVYRDYSNDRGTVVMDRALYLALYARSADHEPRRDAPGPASDVEDLRRRILAAAAGRYALSVSTNRELRREVFVIFDRTFAVTRALEAIAVAVAVLGIANALMASAVERRRSFGLLRAIGASGAQIRRATLVEALLSGLTGTAAALAAGAALRLAAARGHQSAVVRLDRVARRALDDARGSRGARARRVGPRGPRPGRRRRGRRSGGGAAGGVMRRFFSLMLVALAAARAAGRGQQPRRVFSRLSARPRLAPGRGPRVVVLDRAPLRRGRAALRVPAHVLSSPRRAPGALRLVRHRLAAVRVRGEDAPRAARDRGRLGRAPRRLQRGLVRREKRAASQKLSVRTSQGLLALTLEPAKPPVLHGEGGISKKGPGPNEYSHYVSIPRLAVTGTLDRKGRKEALTGTAWFDHEWGPGGLPVGSRRLGLVRAAALRRFGADALPHAPLGRSGLALFRRHLHSGVRSPARDRLEGRDARGADALDVADDRRPSTRPSGPSPSRPSRSRLRSRRCSPTRSW